MKSSFVLAACILVSACSEDPLPLIKSSHADIVARFDSNATAAEQYFKDKRVQVTDTVNSIQGGGTILLVDDKLDPYIVSTSSDSADKVAKMHPGDKVTVECYYVDKTTLSTCDVVQVNPS